MSENRHLEIENGTVGRILRRMTLATLGLDAMDGVSEQSFDVIDRADSFAERLMGGMSNVMPKLHTEYMESRATGLADHILDGMTGLNGPKNATDLGDWQYWLDAALLMLFDEEEDEEEAVAVGTSAKTVAAKSTRQARTAAMQNALRERVVAMKNSGITPAMVQAMSADQKRAVISRLKTAQKSVENSAQSLADTILDAHKTVAGGAETAAISQLAGLIGQNITDNKQFAHAMLSVVKEAAQGRANVADSVSRIFAQDSRQAFVSHIADKASAVSAKLAETSASAANSEKRAEAMRLAGSWSKAVAGLSQAGNVNTAAIRTMMSSIDEMERIGAVSREQAAEVRHAGQAYVRHLLADEVSRDVTAIAGRIEQMVGRVSETTRTDMVSQRAVSFAGNAQNIEAIHVLRNSVAAVADKLGSLSEAVAAKVMSDGDTAATMRWQRAADRFVRMQGISDDVDRVLLRDIVESAEALGNTGIVAPEVVNSIVSIPAQIQTRASKNAEIAQNYVSAETGRTFQSIATGRNAEKLIQSSAIQMLSQISSRVESSVNALVSEIAAAGVNSHQVESFVSDIRRIASQGRAAAGNDSISVIETSSIIESLSDKLDQFAQISARNAVEHGYDELTGESATFVSAVDDVKSEAAAEAAGITAANTVRAANAAAVASVRELQNALRTAQSNAQAQVQAFVAAQKTASRQAESQKLFDSLASAKTVDAMVKAQTALAAHLSSEQQSQLAKTIEAVRSSEAHLENVSRQVRMIENAVKLSSELRNTVQHGINASTRTVNASTAMNAQVQAPVMFSDVRVNRDYLAALGQTLASYGRIRDEFAKVQSGSVSMMSGMDDSRIAKMLSIVSPTGSRTVSGNGSFVDAVSASEMRNMIQVSKDLASQVVGGSVAGSADVSTLAASLQSLRSAQVFSQISRQMESMARIGASRLGTSAEYADLSVSHPETVVGYDEIVPESTAFVSQQNANAFYPSNDTVGDLSAILGSRKAIELHASEMATGRPGSAQTLGQAIERWAEAAHSDNSFVTYGVSENGERVKVTLGLSKNAPAAGYELRQNMGSSYQPAAMRGIAATPVAASLHVDRASSAQTISGVEDFMPVIAGANQTYAAADSSAERVMAAMGGAQVAQNGSAQQISSDASQTQAQSVASNGSVSSILARLGIQFNAGRLADTTSDRMQLNVGNVDFDMTSADFVNMVAKPAIASTSFQAPSLVNSDNVLFSGYASLMNSQGERRSLKSLRKSYVDAVAKSGANSAHGDIGFNTQSFAGIFGIAPSVTGNAFHTTSGAYQTDISRAFVDASAQQNAQNTQSTASGQAYASATASSQSASVAAEESMAQSIISGHEQFEAAGYGSAADFSWISNQIHPQLSAGREAGSYADSASAENNRQILSRIDTMLDYVENMSTREVGVFSSDETVRVLLEALPAEGQLGNKGLPKWRQKDTKATRAAEARELREALAKIGASPVQGTQRFNDRQYVSPNLFNNNQNLAAPLFSGDNTSGGSVPYTSATASGATDSALNSDTIPDDDLQFIAEEIYNKIIDSLSDELKRRRTE